MIGSARRMLGFAPLGAPLLAIVGLSACTGGESDAGPSTVPRIGVTNYVTQPMVTLPATTVPGQTIPPGGTAPGAQEYRVRNGDSVSAIADRFGITIGQLVSYNGWDGPNELITQGDVVKIPPLARVPGVESTTVETLFIGTPLCPDGSEQKTYDVDADDYPGKVAEELGVSVEELDAANESTEGYAVFYPGLEILVPCPADEAVDPAASTSSEP
jgi:LysM repeat protein